MAATTPRAASGVIFALIFVTLATWATWELRLGPISANVGDSLLVAVNSKVIEDYGMVELRYQYTGIETLDYGLRFLVVAFLPGAQGSDKGVKLQQAYFLLSFFPIISIYAIEAGRKRNFRALISFTSIWALLYQTVGGAIVIPLYYLAYMKTSTRPGYWVPSSRAVSASYAQALLPSLVIGYLVPTILIYLPYGNLSITQGYVALWQPAPLIVNLLLSIISLTYSIERPNGKATKNTRAGTTEDAKYINRVYIVNFIAAVATHWVTIAVCLLSSDAELSFRHAFLPNWELFIGKRVNLSLSQGIHYIFQMDFWIIHASSLAWAYLGVLDLNRVSNKVLITPTKAAVVMFINVILFGPGATMAAFCWWREHAMAQRTKAG